MKNELFNSFEPVNPKEWKQRIQVDLKGANYNDKLVWQSPDGIHVKPFYHREEQQVVSVPTRPSNVWSIGRELYVDNTIKSQEKVNELIIAAVNRQATNIILHVASPDINLDIIFKNIPTEINAQLHCNFLSSAFAKAVLNKQQETGRKLYIHCDIITHLIQNGNWYKNLESDHQEYEQLMAINGPVSNITINLEPYQHAGATHVQEAAYFGAIVTEYLDHLIHKGVSLDNKRININVAIGGNYFFEIAKLRALRVLAHHITKAFDTSMHCYITAIPTLRNKTLNDYNNNLLRTSTECMSAILGNADSICNRAYDSFYHKDNEFASRIALNQLLILKEEAYFDKIGDPAHGAYYIETLTSQITSEALTILKDIESNGGFLKQIKNGTIQRKIKEAHLTEQAAFNCQEKVLVGSNKFHENAEKPHGKFEIYPFLKQNPRKTLVAPIIARRLSETYEKEMFDSKENK